MALHTFNVKLRVSDDSSHSAEKEKDHWDEATALVLRYKHRKLSVTDFSSQLWCEMKLYKTLVTGFREESLAMAAGIARHAELELQDHDVKEVEVTTREDLLGLKMYSTVIMLNDLLRVNGKVREVWLAFYNDITDSVIRGVIDEVCLDNNGKLLLKDTKTRRDESTPSQAQKRTSAIQLQMYLWLLERAKHEPERFQWDRFFDIYQCDPSASFTTPELSPWSNLAELLPEYVNAFTQVPDANPYALVEYDFDGKLFQVDTIPYSRSVLEFAVSDMGLFWWNERSVPHSVPIHEKWKCKFCPFVDTCTVTPLSGSELEAAINDLKLKRGLADDLEELI